MRVNDILTATPNSLKAVLVLESPYDTEIIHNHPLAGYSGQEVTNYIKNALSGNNQSTNNAIVQTFNRPFGCELKSLQYSELGIMNCSLFPLDKLVRNKLLCQKQTTRLSTYIDALDLIRKYPNSQSRKHSTHQAIEQKLLAKFHLRMDDLIRLSPQIKFVACGNLAHKFVAAYNLKNPNVQISSTQIINIPHPSYGGWKSTFQNKSQFDGLLYGLTFR